MYYVTEPVTAGADATVQYMFLGLYTVEYEHICKINESDNKIIPEIYIWKENMFNTTIMERE